VRDLISFSAPPAAPPRGTPVGTSSPSAASPGPIDVNRADLDALQALPGIGPAIAERILVARREQPFTSVDDLVRVSGIGPATVERLRPYATVGR